MYNDLAELFPRYIDFDPLVPVWCVTPNAGRTIHRFFDTSPFSPSGRYLGLTRLPFEDRLPSPGDVAEIVLVDLATGQERIIAESRGWDTQLGAQVQWGAKDTRLFFNDVDTTTWRAFGVVMDPFSGEKRILDGTVYTVSPDGKWSVSPCLKRISIAKPGYGVVVPQEYVPTNAGAPAQDGVYITDTVSGECKLLISLEQIVKTALPPLDSAEYKDGDFYSFHVKWNPQGDRLMLVLHWIPRRKGAQKRLQVITMSADGSDVRIAIPASEWDKGGHHPNWCPDGETVMMNLRIYETPSRAHPSFFDRIRRRILRACNSRSRRMYLVHARYDGGAYGAMSDLVLGSGHPSLHPNGRHVVTDAYPHEAVAFGDGTTPIRLIDLDASRDVALVRIKTVPPYKGPRNELRVDPHPAWDRGFQRLAFNACEDDTRRVYVADLANVLR